jgi:hypothetical protein
MKEMEALVACNLCPEVDGKAPLKKALSITETGKYDAEVTLECLHKVKVIVKVGVFDLVKKTHNVKLVQETP